MTLNDIPKLFGAGEESGDAPATDRMTRFSHNLPSRETVEYLLATSAHGALRAYGPAQVISIGSRSRVCKGSRGQRRVELDLTSGALKKTHDSFFHRNPKPTVPQETDHERQDCDILDSR